MGVVLNFDSTNVPVAAALDPIPAGWYTAAIVESEMKPTATPGGMYLELKLEVLDGPYKGRNVWDRLNLQNANPVAVEIAYKQLSAICHATGVIQVADSSQLHNRPMQVKVSMRSAGKGADGRDYEANNEVKGYKGMDQAQPVAAPTFAPPPVAAPVPPGSTPAAPWTPPAAAPAAPAAPAWQPPAAAPAAPPAPPAWTPPAAPPAPAPAAAPAAAAPPWAVPGSAAPVAPPWATKK